MAGVNDACKPYMEGTEKRWDKNTEGKESWRRQVQKKGVNENRAFPILSLGVVIQKA